MPSYRLTLAYDGTDFSGSQVQSNQRTVQGELERVLAGLHGDPARAVFAGRTDRGVHAVGQVVALRLPNWRGSARELQRALNAGLPADLGATEVAECDDAFNPRFDACWREYRYWIAPTVVSPFVRRYAWTPRTGVELQAMAAGAKWLVGTHDFASFAGGGEGVPWSERASRPRGTTRSVLRCECRESYVREGPGADRRVQLVEIRVAADGFLPRMVRSIAGALVEVGQGRRNPEWIDELLASRDRRLGSVVAPPHGLTLHRIGYGRDHLGDW